MNETQQKQQDADEAVQLVTGVLLIAFALVGVAALLAVQVSHVFSR